LKDLKRAARDLVTRGKSAGREIDGHSTSDDVGNAGDRIRQDYGNAKDEAQDEARKSRNQADDERARRDANP
jgi:hypothetical protein